MHRLALSVTVLSMLAHPVPLIAQAELVVEDAIACPACIISIREIGRLGGPSDTLGFGSLDGSTLAFTSDDRVWIAPGLLPPALAVFKLDGALQRVIYERGEGPGEWTRIDRIGSGRPGEVIVAGSGRLGTYTSYGELLRQVPLLTQASQIVGLPDGATAVVGYMSGPGRTNLPVHLVAPSGEVQVSFGPRRTDARPFPGMSVTPRPEGGVWTLNHRTYELIAWSGEGQAEVSLRRASEWFEPWTDWIGPFSSRPPTRPLWVYEDDEGLLWVTALVADDDFEIPPLPNDIVSEAPDFRAIYDSVVEVIDPQRGVVLSRARFDDALWGPLTGRRGFTSYQTEMGFFVFALIEYQLDGQHER